MDNIKQRLLLVAIGIGLALFVVLAPISVLLAWGDRQAITVARIEHRVHRRMSIGDICYCLALPPDAFDKSVSAIVPSAAPEASYILTVSNSGIGALFVPQHNITLYLDSNKQVTTGIDKVHYQFDEANETIEIGD